MSARSTGSSDDTDTVIRKIRAAEGHPGVLDTIGGAEFFLFGAHRERELRGAPGRVRRAADGRDLPGDGRRRRLDHSPQAGRHARPIGISSSRPRPRWRSPASTSICRRSRSPSARSCRLDHTYREISYEEHGPVGYVRFDFYNGAMSTQQCKRLREAYVAARSRPQTKVIVLMGGDDYFSNGIHLNVIEAADDPALESWQNLNAIDDVVSEIIHTDSHMVISALGGDAAAGGVPLALAADQVVAREDVVLNPYYGHMGGLYGSEYWTYLLPRRIGAEMTARLTSAPFIRSAPSRRSGSGCSTTRSERPSRTSRERSRARRADRRRSRARAPAGTEARRRAHDEMAKPLHAYRREELARSHRCFFGPDPSYHEARHRFVYKLGGGGEGQATPRTADALALNVNDPAAQRAAGQHSARSAA